MAGPTLQETTARVLALPREAGTAEAAEARELVAAYLKGLGYRVTEQRFRFHPASLLAFPVFGAGLGGLTLLTLPLLLFDGPPDWAAFALASIGLGALALLAIGIGVGWMPIGGEMREDANLLAVRSPQPIRRWLVAHLDTKAQAQSMAGRLISIWVVIAAIAMLLGLGLFRLDGTLPIALVVPATLLAVTAGALAGRGRINGRSLGARDNGSGVVAALAAAQRLEDPSVGVLITGAEEFGMVGARVFAALESSRLDGVEIVNFDTLDQEGDLYLVSHDRRGARLAAEQAPRLTGLGPPVRPRRLPLGILVDSLPLARGGAVAITIGRLTWNTLRRIHTAQDVPEGLSLELAEKVGQAIAMN
ncbi:MAG: M28 family peptidase [Gemmatimonadales bacterium]